MKSLLRLLAVAAVILPQPICAAAQKKTTAPTGDMDFTPVHLVLGMPKNRAITELSESFDVSPWKGRDIEDSWAISEKTGGHFVIGQLGFESGVLIAASKFWNVEDSAYELAHTVSLLIDRLHDEGFAHCAISSRKEAAPSSESDILTIDCGQKGIVVKADQLRGKDVKFAQVTENLWAR